MAKKKTAIVNRRRVLTDPVFELTRQNNAEFTRACKANRLLRRAFALAMLNKADRYVSGRLTKTMFNILQSDPVNGRGERRVTNGVLGILEGFNFNRDTSLQNVLRGPYSVTINHDITQATISFPSFMAKAMIETTSGANACMLSGIAASLSLEEETWPVNPVQTDKMNIILHPREPLQLQLPVIEHKSTNAIIIALGIEFFHEIHGGYQPVEKKHNVLAVVKVFPANEV
ncbi:hypothetical protein A3860_21045 [Niastella vici]|uniref:Uncharacterized protein n=1 Tax=Niastella vici TaxID=1703345 RepID=A0A1V9G1M4_9BACT|nr:hypothetical protein [Niastella vici]OQP64457.1 hypothetical protein A3860_21045 [Niastella vici]